MATYNYQKSKNSYSVYTDNGNFSYSVKKYGKYAELMAKYSCKTGVKLKNWFEKKDDYIILYSYDVNTDFYYEILIDVNDYDLVKNYYWKATKTSSDKKTYYAISEQGTAGKNKTKIRLHRLIMNVTESKDEIDHIDNNGLNNRRNNLRITNTLINTRNKINPNKFNTVGISGVQKRDNRYIAQWQDENMKKRSKSFSINEYGENRAKQLAIEYRKMMVKKYYKRDEK